MPTGTVVAKVEEHLKAAARKKKFKGKRAARYIYGALNNMGLKRGSETTSLGARKARPTILQP